MRHILGIDVIPTINDQIIHLFDTSLYSDGLQITCPRLEISIPGFRDIRLLEPDSLFNLALNGVDLNLIHEDADELPALPDGLYNIKYSISPNEYVHVEIDHLRTVILEKEIFKLRCAVGMSSCTPSEEMHKQLKSINELEDYVKAAKAYVECEMLDEALDLFEYAHKLLKRISVQSC